MKVTLATCDVVLSEKKLALDLAFILLLLWELPPEVPRPG